MRLLRLLTDDAVQTFNSIGSLPKSDGLLRTYVGKKWISGHSAQTLNSRCMKLCLVYRQLKFVALVVYLDTKGLQDVKNKLHEIYSVSSILQN